MLFSSIKAFHTAPVGKSHFEGEVFDTGRGTKYPTPDLWPSRMFGFYFSHSPKHKTILEWDSCRGGRVGMGHCRCFWDVRVLLPLSVALGRRARLPLMSPAPSAHLFDSHPFWNRDICCLVYSRGLDLQLWAGGGAEHPEWDQLVFLMTCRPCLISLRNPQ